MKPSALLAVILLCLVPPVPGQNPPELGVESYQYGAQPKSESVALSQSVSNTLIPLAAGWGSVWIFDNGTVESIGASLAVYGLIVGPSTGNLYADDFLRGGVGILARAAGAWLMQDATAELFGRNFADALSVDNRRASFRDTGVLVGSGLFLGSIAFNLITSRHSVREYNRSRGLRMGAGMFQSPFTGSAPTISAVIPL